MIQVYHYRRLDTGDRGDSPLWLLVKVAEVAADDLEVAFRQTNHIDRAWTENPDVTVVTSSVAPAAQCHRSTMVGDVMAHDGTWHLVAPFGFMPVPRKPPLVGLEDPYVLAFRQWNEEAEQQRARMKETSTSGYLHG